MDPRSACRNVRTSPARCAPHRSSRSRRSSRSNRARRVFRAWSCGRRSQCRSVRNSHEAMCSPSLTSLFRRASLHLKCHLSRFGTRSAPTVVEEKEEENTEEVLLPLSQPLSSRAPLEISAALVAFLGYSSMARRLLRSQSGSLVRRSARGGTVCSLSDCSRRRSRACRRKGMAVPSVWWGG